MSPAGQGTPPDLVVGTLCEFFDYRPDTPPNRGLRCAASALGKQVGSVMGSNEGDLLRVEPGDGDGFVGGSSVTAHQGRHLGW